MSTSENHGDSSRLRPPLGSMESRFMFVCLYVCVLRHIRGYGNGTNHREIEGVIGYLCLLGFIILIKICIKTRSWTGDGFGDLVMYEEGVRHPTTSARKRLPPSMCSCVCLTKQNVGLFLGTNVSTLSGVHQLVMHTFDAVGFVILCSPFEYLVTFRVFGEAMAKYTWSPNIVH